VVSEARHIVALVQIGVGDQEERKVGRPRDPSSTGKFGL
jgi:hypothetical protein